MKLKHIPSNFLILSFVVIVLFAISYFLKPIDKKGYILSEKTNTTEDKLKPYFNSEKEFTNIYKNVIDTGKLNSLAVILSHHYLTARDIAQTLHLVNNEKIKKIILIGPDHFNNLGSTSGVAYTTNLNWDTVFGEVESFAINNVEINNLSFKGEHSVYTLIPFIKKEFPNAKVGSLIINVNADEADLSLLGENLSNEYGSDETLIIVSSDFTHEADSINETLKNDSKSIINLRSGKFGSDQIKSDCNKCFVVLNSYLNKDDASFYLVKNSNSTDYGGEEQNITSYVFGLFLDNSVTSQINFVGDMMFDRSIRQRAESHGYRKIFDQVSHILDSGDVNIGNLEGPITNNNSLSLGSEIGSKNNYIFTFSPKVIPVLKENKFLILNIGNNHILNFGVDGLNSTFENLSDNGLSYFGDLKSQSNLNKYIIKEIGSKKIAIVNYNEFGGNGIEEISKLISDTKKDSDLLFVYTHWGIEYLLESPDYIKNTAYRFIDSGADLIIGSHPHVIQQFELYKGKPIYYSLGNFVMDQYFDENVKKGLLLKVFITDDNKLLFEEIPTESLLDGTVGLK